MNFNVSKIFYGHIYDFSTPSRPLHGHSRPPIFHGHQFFSTATFLENGRHHGHLTPLMVEGPGRCVVLYIRRTLRGVV
jgi:hypothetical protein